MNKLSILIALLLTTMGASAITPAERSIDTARAHVSEHPERVSGHVELAMGLARRARETGDPKFYDTATAAIQRALKVAPEDFAALRTRVWILLGQHEFAAARTAAETLNKRAPDDLMTYAMLVDAYVETGDYTAAEEAAQWLLDIRPGNIPGLTRAAYLRELFGDLEGAIELMVQAVRNTPQDQTEERAWILSHLAKLQLYSGRIDLADRIVSEALDIFPDYHYALGQLIRIRVAQSRLGDSVAIARKFYDAVPHPENRYVLAEALLRNGSTEAAALEFDAFKRVAMAESDRADNANHELIKYLVDHGDDPSAVLAIAEREIGRRRDVLTLDAYAWALHHAGHCERAREIMAEVLAVGVRDPEILFHAGFINVGEPESANQFLRDALAIAPWSDFAPAARAALAQREKVQARLKIPASITVEKSNL